MPFDRRPVVASSLCAERQPPGPYYCNYPAYRSPRHRTHPGYSVSPRRTSSSRDSSHVRTCSIRLLAYRVVSLYIAFVHPSSLQRDTSRIRYYSRSFLNAGSQRDTPRLLCYENDVSWGSQIRVRSGSHRRLRTCCSKSNRVGRQGVDLYRTMVSC